MQCCVPFCKTATELVCGSEGLTFHRLPIEVHLRAAWLRALCKENTSLPDSAVVCSQHFLNDEMYETQSGLKKICFGASPSTVQVCMMCLDTHSKLFSMRKYKLEEAYENLMGHPLSNQGNLKQTLCIQCAQRLVNFSRFRDNSLRAHSLMMELIKKHKLITIQHMALIDDVRNQLKLNIVQTVIKPDHCDLYIDHSDEDKQTESVTLKNEKIDAMSVDEDYTQRNTEVRNEDKNDENCFSLIISKEEYMSDDNLPLEPKQTTDPILAKPITSNDDVAETQARIKFEITVECKICLKEFSDEDLLNHHMTMHTEEDQKLEDSTADYADTSVAPLPVGLSKKHENKVHPADANKNKSIENMKITIENLSLNPVQKPAELMANNRNSVDFKTKRSETENELDSKISQENNLLRIHTEETQYICDNCQKVFQRKSSLVDHLKCHTCTKQITCKFCPYKCKYNSMLVTHMRTHTKEKPFACNLCEYKCAVKNRLVRHMRTHTGEKPYTCTTCEYKCVDKTALVIHMRTHNGEKPFACKLCDYKCAQSGHLVAHMRTHTGEKPFSCRLCEFKSKHSSYLVYHMRTHTGEKPFSCKLCDFKCAQKSSLLSHMKTHGEYQFYCASCDYKCVSKSSFGRHIKTHAEEKPLSCKLCEYKCIVNKDLVVHMRTHTGEKPFACTLCEYKAIAKSYLVKHMRTHTGEKPYSCKLCEYRCTVSSSLISHMRTHTGVKPFSCELCDYKCVNKCTFMRHMSIHIANRTHLARM